jgi:hypothetical protein
VDPDEAPEEDTEAEEDCSDIPPINDAYDFVGIDFDHVFTYRRMYQKLGLSQGFTFKGSIMSFSRTLFFSFSLVHALADWKLGKCDLGEVGCLSYADATAQAERQGSPVPAVNINVNASLIVNGARALMRCYSAKAKKARKLGHCWWGIISNVEATAGTFDAVYEDKDTGTGKRFAHITQIDESNGNDPVASPIDPDPLPSANPMGSLLFDLLEGLLQRVGFDPFDEFIRLGRGEPIIENLHTWVALFCIKQRPNLTRTYSGLYDHWWHIRQNNPGVLASVLKRALSANDVYNELFNGIVSANINMRQGVDL